MASAIGRAVSNAIEDLELNLRDHVVVTEAATGSYAVTAAAAAAAGAEVHAFASDSRFGSARSAIRDVDRVASALGVPEDSIRFHTSKSSLPLEDATLITNSGSVRPIGPAEIERLTSRAVIALMYEAWETRPVDIDLRFAAAKGIDVIGVNEHHPSCGAFAYVGDLALYGLRQMQWPVRGSHITIFSDNLFFEPVRESLVAGGATVTHRSDTGRVPSQTDLVIVAMSPPGSLAGRTDPRDLAEAVAATRAFGCVQVWGDIDREVLDREGIEVIPAAPPAAGHQGFPMSAAGFTAVVRLQIGGLSAAIHPSVPAAHRLYGLAQRPEWEELQ